LLIMPEPQIIKSKRRTIALQIAPDGTLLVRAPLRASMHQIQQFIDYNREWIDEHLQKVEMRPRVDKHSFKEGETFWFLGNKVILTIGEFKQIEVKGDKLLFPRILVFRVQKELTAWYIKQARLLITQQVEYFAEQMKTSFISLTFSDTKSQWGRCTKDNRLQFSWRLIMSPLLTLNYVVIHELAHTLEKNHSRAFWSRVRLYNPSYRQQIKWLQTHGQTLTV